jgi:hypothetical protein
MAEGSQPWAGYRYNNGFQKEDKMKRVIIGIAVGAILALAGFGIESLVGIVLLAIAGVTIVAAVIVITSRANRRARVLELRMLNVLNQQGR